MCAWKTCHFHKTRLLVEAFCCSSIWEPCNWAWPLTHELCRTRPNHYQAWVQTNGTNGTNGEKRKNNSEKVEVENVKEQMVYGHPSGCKHRKKVFTRCGMLGIHQSLWSHSCFNLVGKAWSEYYLPYPCDWYGFAKWWRKPLEFSRKHDVCAQLFAKWIGVHSFYQLHTYGREQKVPSNMYCVTGWYITPNRGYTKKQQVWYNISCSQTFQSHCSWQSNTPMKSALQKMRFQLM